MEVNLNPGKLFIGTSGWSYKHWTGVFYPEEISPDKYLEYYLTKFDSVELNSSFYHLPFKSTVDGWVRRTPERFRFCIKLSRFITHQKHLLNIEEAMANYFAVFRRMKSRLGPVLVQLPPGLYYDKDLICYFLDLLNEKYSGYRFAIEVRHQSWVRDEFFDLLSRNSVAFVIADSGGQFPYADAMTTDYVYIRFHGRELIYASDYDEADLEYYAKKIRGWQSEGKDVWAFFNNDYSGYAPKNASKLLEIIQSYS
ncbi:DUF72 domain-containing protein [Bacteroides sedimenti]|uniref:DUF72 domain-containing protein n=1 Tax=Bacteroides sedimenti TaxID=2136147 RepID=A0ABN6Z6W2_9BACE